MSATFARPPTTKFSAKSFVFKNNGAKEGLKKDNPSGLDAGGPRFKSGRPDHLTLHCSNRYGIIWGRREKVLVVAVRNFLPTQSFDCG
jgi:hypothetical protein